MAARVTPKGGSDRKGSDDKKSSRLQMLMFAENPDWISSKHNLDPSPSGPPSATSPFDRFRVLSNNTRHILINNSGSICRTTTFQLCTEWRDCHKSKNVYNISVTFIGYLLLNNKAGVIFDRLFHNNVILNISFG